MPAMTMQDRWLNASEVAAHLGMTVDGKPNRRGFLARVACLPDFPSPMQVGAHRAWRLSEVDLWAVNQRKSA